MAGGRISTGTSSRRGIDVNIRIEGVDKTSQEFKDFRRNANARIRGVMVKVGTRRLLPAMRSQLPSRWGDSLFVQKERSGVFVGSKQRGPMNRAFGWYDFGGQRPLDSMRRTGPKVMVRTLDRYRDTIDDEVLEELLAEFDTIEHHP